MHWRTRTYASPYEVRISRSTRVRDGALVPATGGYRVVTGIAPAAATAFSVTCGSCDTGR
jgi:hypothetical protein